MFNKCSVYGCYTNFDGHERATVFGLNSLNSHPELRENWFRFINRNDLQRDSKSIFICIKHFEEKYIKQNKARPRLIMELNPIPTILQEEIYSKKPSCLPTVPVECRKPPKERVYQEDQLEKFKSKFCIQSFSDVNSSLLDVLGDTYQCQEHFDHVVYFKTVLSELSLPEVTECIRVDSNLHVKLFYKGSPISLPEWFRKGSKCILNSKDILQNFPAYIKQEAEKLGGGILEELVNIQFKKCPVYSANLIRHALILRYTSLAAYKQIVNELNFPSVSMLRKITSGKVDAIKSLETLRENGRMSNDLILMFDEMYLQKCEEYSGGECIGANGDGELFKGI